MTGENRKNVGEPITREEDKDKSNDIESPWLTSFYSMKRILKWKFIREYVICESK